MDRCFLHFTLIGSEIYFIGFLEGLMGLETQLPIGVDN